MKKLFLFCIIPLIGVCCQKPPAEVYKEAELQYEGNYVVKEMITDSHQVYDLFGGEFGKQYASDNIYSQFYARLTPPWGRGEIGSAKLSINPTDGSGEVRFVFQIQTIDSSSMPPYTVDTPAYGGYNLITTGQSIPLSVQMDMSLAWSKGIVEKDNYNFSLSLLGPAEVRAFDGNTMDIYIEEFPIYDYKQKKALLIPITYHLERE